MTRRASGFSLLEMAFVLIIVTLLLGGLLVPFATQVEQKRIVETQKALEEIKEALIGYALSHSSTATPTQPYLPCPDAITLPAGSTNTTNDGIEDRVAGTGLCERDEGNFPWVTLGVGGQDAWGNRFHYRVSAATSSSVTGFGLGSSGDINICNAAPAAGALECAAGTSLATDVPVIVLSYGKNGYGALNVNSLGVRNPPPPGINPEEGANQPLAVLPHPIFVSRTLTLPGAGNAEFDDQVTWLSLNILFNRMVAAGRLP